MAFKIYNNRKTRHPSISLKSGDKKHWHNLEITHSPIKNERYFEITNVNSQENRKSFVRKYYRRDKHKLKGFWYKKFRLSRDSEIRVKRYLNEHHINKKR